MTLDGTNECHRSGAWSEINTRQMNLGLKPTLGKLEDSQVGQAANASSLSSREREREREREKEKEKERKRERTRMNCTLRLSAPECNYIAFKCAWIECNKEHRSLQGTSFYPFVSRFHCTVLFASFRLLSLGSLSHWLTARAHKIDIQNSMQGRRERERERAKKKKHASRIKKMWEKCELGQNA